MWVARNDERIDPKRHVLINAIRHLLRNTNQCRTGA